MLLSPQQRAIPETVTAQVFRGLAVICETEPKSSGTLVGFCDKVPLLLKWLQHLASPILVTAQEWPKPVETSAAGPPTSGTYDLGATLEPQHLIPPLRLSEQIAFSPTETLWISIKLSGTEFSEFRKSPQHLTTFDVPTTQVR
jgi:hypothetical protein